jgi:hypothetical protein
MDSLLPITWYTESPIDFEHKQYMLFNYLQKVDSNFQNKILSPHLLHLEKIMDELFYFENVFDMIIGDFNKNRYQYFDNPKLEGENNKLIYEIREIVDFAIPQIEPRIKFGYSVLKRNSQILY